MAEERRQPGRLPAIVLAVLVHVAFIAVLVFGVDWQNHEPAPVVAELWNSLPGVTPPPPPPPQPEPKPEPEPEKPKPEHKPEPKPEPPPPAKADIALKKAKEEKLKEEKLKEEKRKEEDKKKELEKKKKEQEEQRKKAEKEYQELIARQARADEETLKANQAAENARRAAASARNSEIGKYTGMIRDKIRGNIVAPPDMLGNPQAVFEVTVIPSGEVINVRMTKSSGNAAYDNAVERAIRKSSPLPLPPPERGLFETFRQSELKIRPTE